MRRWAGRDAVFLRGANFKFADSYRLTTTTPVARRAIVMAGDDRAAVAALVAFQLVLCDLVTDALNEGQLAAGAIRRLLLGRLNIAHVRIVEAAARGDFIGG